MQMRCKSMCASSWSYFVISSQTTILYIRPGRSVSSNLYPFLRDFKKKKKPGGDTSRRFIYLKKCEVMPLEYVGTGGNIYS